MNSSGQQTLDINGLGFVFGLAFGFTRYGHATHPVKVVIGILAGPNPAEVKSGLAAAVNMIENVAHFVSANEDDSIPYYAFCISRTGSYLSESAGVPEGEALAYLIAPPLEALYGVDAALKAADVTMCVLYGPPSETNFGGALLTGSQSACKSACEAFAAAVEFVAENPRQ